MESLRKVLLSSHQVKIITHNHIHPFQFNCVGLIVGPMGAKRSPFPPPSQRPCEEIVLDGKADEGESKKNELIQSIIDNATDCTSKTTDADMCSICLDGFSDSEKALKFSECGEHYFHIECAEDTLKRYGKCPICSHDYVPSPGPMPNGKMTVFEMAPGSGFDVDGFPGCGCIVVSFDFRDGIQSDNHPNPGSRYSGTSRTVYFPDCPEGRRGFELIKEGFKRRLLFIVGTSVTTGREDCVIWGVHMKTSLSGGQSSYGYPDPTYWDRLEGEMIARGVNLPKPGDNSSINEADGCGDEQKVP